MVLMDINWWNQSKPKMSLDKNRLEKIKDLPDGSYTARCPACAAVSGGDSLGTHLKVYANGKYGCAAYQGDSDHRQEIWKLAGAKTPKGKKPVTSARFEKPVIRVKKLIIPPARTLFEMPLA